MSARTAAIAASGVALLVLAGCALEADEPAAPSPSSSTSTGPAPSGPLPTPSIHEEHEPPVSTAAASLTSAADTAAELLALFCRPGTERQEWIDALFPFLTENAGTAYGTVDPRTIPCSAVTGAATLEAGANDFYAVAILPTDAGNYRIELERRDVDAPWLALRIQPSA